MYYIYFQLLPTPKYISPLGSASPNSGAEKMKLNFHFGALLLLFLFFLISSSKLSTHPLITEPGQNRKLDKVTGEDFVSELEGSESMKEMQGTEDCNSGDDECLERRMTFEAHLDYIYTQHHNKP